MAITEARPEAATSGSPAIGYQRHPIWEWLTTTDHKKIGIMYLVNSYIFFGVAGLLAMFIRTELAEPGTQFFNEQQFNELFTMHGTTMIFLFVIPILAGFANYIVPLQIGALDMAFPRVNALSFWMLPLAGVILYSGYLVGGTACAGWTEYPPLSEQGCTGATSGGIGADLWIIALLLIGTSSILGAVNFITTIFNMRAPGMTMFRMPMFCWTMLVTSLLVLLASGGVRDGAARHGHRLRDPAGVLAQAAVRLQGLRVRHRRHRRARLQRLGPPHVRHRHGAAAVLQPDDLPHRGAHRGQVLQLDLDHVEGEAHLRHADAVRGGVPDDVPDRRRGRRVPGLPAGGLRPARHLLGDRPHPLRAVRRQRLRRVRGLLLLVPQVHRQEAERGARQAALLAPVHRVQPDLLPDAHPGAARHAAPCPGLPAAARLDRHQPAPDPGRLHHRRVHGALPGQHRAHHAAQDPRRGESLGRQHPGMGHDLAAAAAQLRQPARDPLRTTAVRPAPRR